MDSFETISNKLAVAFPRQMISQLECVIEYLKEREQVLVGKSQAWRKKRARQLEPARTWAKERNLSCGKRTVEETTNH